MEELKNWYIQEVVKKTGKEKEEIWKKRYCYRRRKSKKRKVMLEPN